MSENRKWVRQYDEEDYAKITALLEAIESVIAMEKRYAQTHGERNGFNRVVDTLCYRLREAIRSGTSLTVPMEADSKIPF